EHAEVPQFIVENHDMVREQTNHKSHYFIADGAQLCKDLLPLVDADQGHADWLNVWIELETIAKNRLNEAKSPTLTEGTAVREVVKQLRSGDCVFVANSMPIRDVDTFFMPTEKQISVYANRGVSGIDGTLSSALGVAAAGKRVTLIIGDLSFYHDLNSLFIAMRYRLPITIVLLNNNGGGIFSFLPQAKEEKHFEHLFGTPLDIDFR